MNTENNLINQISIYLYIFDICLIPTYHIAGLPFKVAYLLGVMWLALYIGGFNVWLGSALLYNGENNRILRHSKMGRRMILTVTGIILATCLGELTAAVYTRFSDTTPFRDAIFFYVILICSMGFGYIKYDFNKDFLVLVLILYCTVNILLSALGTSAPYFIRNLYRYVGDGESKFDMIRIGGTMGNPNATLCVMNILFMSIIVFIRKDKIGINNTIKPIAIMLFPLLTNCFLNSRGEFLVTVALEAVLLYTVFQKQKDVFKILMWALVIAFFGIIVFNLVFQNLIQKYPTVAYSIERLMTLFDFNSSKATDSVSDRPFIHLDEFLDRFKKSPIWGTGFSAGYDYPFIRASERYHNDWFRIFASGGLIGGALWIYMIYIAVKQCGFFFLLPFFVTAISNTFVGSYAALGVYFITVMSLIRYSEILNEEISLHYTSLNSENR